MNSIINTPLRLRNGSVLSNRIAKSAMSENLGDKNFSPTKTLINVYKEWAKSGAGLLISGNIMIDSSAIGEPRNVVVENRNDMSLLKEWADSVKGTQVQLWAQLNHPGRQAMEQINPILKGPSAVPLVLGGRKKASKKIPIAMTEAEIWDCIERFATTSEILKEAGFSGVQIHGAHGYLVNQFLSPHSNVRDDQWGGSLENRAKFVLEVFRKIRQKVGPEFPIGIKLNSADFQKGGFTEEESMEIVKMLSNEGIDLIEISGGTYEAPAMMGYKKESTKKREAYFIDYIEKARKITDTPLMLTGGFRSPKGMHEALETGDLDVVGLARPFVMYPKIGHEIIEKSRENFHTSPSKSGVKAIDGFMNIIWYEAQIKRIGEGKEPKHKLGAWGVFFKYALLIGGFSKKKKKK